MEWDNDLRERRETKCHEVKRKRLKGVKAQDDATDRERERERGRIQFLEREEKNEREGDGSKLLFFF